MCVWKRIHLLPMTLQQLCRQIGVVVDFYIWNNNGSVVYKVEKIAATYRSDINIQIHHHPSNVACIGRFWLASRLRNRYPFVVFIDDDQQFNDTFLLTLWNERVSGGVAACHCLSFIKGEDYWTRTRPNPGDSATYCGPGGMIMDTRLLAHQELQTCHRNSWIMDDIWLSHFLGHKLGSPIVKSSAELVMIDRANDTFLGLRDKKRAYLDELRAKGWDV
jgi:hypothetical protein